MNNNLKYEFAVDKDASQVVIIKEFDAEQSLVWEAFSDPGILDQWGAPSPWVCNTKSMEFKPGGRRLFSMTSPEGQVYWSIQDFTSITPITNMQYISNIADSEGNSNPAFKGAANNIDFSEVNGITTVKITITYENPEVLVMMVENGFREGFAAVMNILDILLSTKKNNLK